LICLVLRLAAGHLPFNKEGKLYNGKVGKDYTTEEAYEAAQACALAILGTVKAEVGDLDKIKRVVKIMGFVNCVDTYSAQPKVLNGVSDLLGEVLGDRGAQRREGARVVRVGVEL
jgi:TM2 domain-containing membrane protein YozV